MKPEQVIDQIQEYLKFKGTGQEALLTFKVKVRILINQYNADKDADK